MERAVVTSCLPPPSRHIVLMLCTRMQKGSIKIPAQHSPSLTWLARATGWNRRTVMRHLSHLERDGWLTRHRPDPEMARKFYVTTSYAVSYPQLGTGSPGLEADDPGSLEAEDGRPGGAVPRIQTESDPLSDPEIELVMHELENRTGRTISAEWAAKTRDFILARPGVRNRQAYLRRVLTTDPDPLRFLPTNQPPPFKAPGKTKGKS